LSHVPRYRTRAHRHCLKCDKPFASAGPWNRICPPCHKLNRRFCKLRESVLEGQRGEKRHNGDLLYTPDALENLSTV
jgi:hypothetical protein